MSEKPKVIMPAQLELVKNIDFTNGCDISDGQCNNSRKDKRGYICCTHCAYYIGYLKIPHEDLPDDYKTLFDPQKGFLGDTGCKLPLEKRSVNCVCFACINCDISTEERALLEQAERMEWR